jgi:hypothetical protein
MKMKNKRDKFAIFIFIIIIITLFQSCTIKNPRLVLGGGTSSHTLGVPVGPEPERGTGMFQWGFIATHWEGKNKKFAIESELDGQIFTGNNSTEFGITYSASSRYNFTENISLSIGGGPSHIVDGGNFDQLDDSWLYGNIRTNLTIHKWRIGIDHYSSPFDSDGGINLLIFGREF